MKSLIKRPVLFNNFFSKPYLNKVTGKSELTQQKGNSGRRLQFPLIQLPRKSEGGCLPLFNGSQKFPLIQLPRKSEEGTIDDLSTEELQKFPLIQLPRKSEDDAIAQRYLECLVSINSTSEEVRREGFVSWYNKRIKVSINSTSEEVRRHWKV